MRSDYCGFDRCEWRPLWYNRRRYQCRVCGTQTETANQAHPNARRNQIQALEHDVFPGQSREWYGHNQCSLCTRQRLASAPSTAELNAGTWLQTKSQHGRIEWVSIPEFGQAETRYVPGSQP